MAIPQGEPASSPTHRHELACGERTTREQLHPPPPTPSLPLAHRIAGSDPCRCAVSRRIICDMCSSTSDTGSGTYLIPDRRDTVLRACAADLGFHTLYMNHDTKRAPRRPAANGARADPNIRRSTRLGRRPESSESGPDGDLTRSWGNPLVVGGVEGSRPVEPWRVDPGRRRTALPRHLFERCGKVAAATARAR